MQRRDGRSLRIGIAMLIAVATGMGSRDALAFCRSTTCDVKTTTCKTDDNGCPKGGAPLSWRALPLVYRFHQAGSEKLDMDRAKEVVRRAFQTWSNVTCRGKRTSLRFEEGSDIPGRTPLAGQGPAKIAFGVYFRDEVWPYDDGEESLALTNQTFGKDNGYIDYSDIEVNTSARDFALADNEKGIDLQAVLTHEVGHYIGLAHSQVERSIMVASYCESGDRCGRGIDESRALDDDDITAVCALYPPSGIAGVAYEDPDATGCSASPSAPERSRSWPASLGVLAALALAFAARRA